MGVGEGLTISCFTGEVWTLCLFRVDARLWEEEGLRCAVRLAAMNCRRVSTEPGGGATVDHHTHCLLA